MGELAKTLKLSYQVTENFSSELYSTIGVLFPILPFTIAIQ